MWFCNDYCFKTIKKIFFSKTFIFFEIMSVIRQMNQLVPSFSLNLTIVFGKLF